MTAARGRVRAVLFDVDGTLYDQRAVRARMATELALFAAGRPRAGWRVLRVLKAYREAHEQLRATGARCLAVSQIELAAEQTAASLEEVAAIVDEWMIERPLKHLSRHRATGVVELMEWLSGRNIAIGVLSDYPAERKLTALGIAGCLSPVLCTSDATIAALKPNPKGFTVAADQWGISPAEVLMVGDREDVDGAGAAAAGMPSAIVRRQAGKSRDPWMTFVSSFEQVRSVIDDRS